MAKTYMTVQGDTWDIIAKKEYGDEKYAGVIMQANYAYLDVFIFDSGITLNIPELEKEQVTDSTLPPWRQ